jgi:hypothetical protein
MAKTLKRKRASIYTRIKRTQKTRRQRGGAYVDYKIKFKAILDTYSNLPLNTTIYDIAVKRFKNKIKWRKAIEGIMDHVYMESQNNSQPPIEPPPTDIINIKIQTKSYPDNKTIRGIVSWRSWFVDREKLADYLDEDSGDSIIKKIFYNQSADNWLVEDLETTLLDNEQQTQQTQQSQQNEIIEKRNIKIPKNEITYEPLVNGENMVNFHDEFEFGRYYKDSTFESFPVKSHGYKENPSTRKPIKPENIKKYKVHDV